MFVYWIVIFLTCGKQDNIYLLDFLNLMISSLTAQHSICVNLLIIITIIIVTLFIIIIIIIKYIY